VAFNFITVAPFLKFNISTMCYYKIMIKKYLKNQLSEFMYLYFHLYSLYIKVYIYFLVEFCTFGFTLKKYTIVTTDIHFSSIRVITKVCLTHVRSLYAVLTSVWCLEMKHDHIS
jgi:hypothetical protein